MGGVEKRHRNRETDKQVRQSDPQVDSQRDR